MKKISKIFAYSNESFNTHFFFKKKKIEIPHPLTNPDASAGMLMTGRLGSMVGPRSPVPARGSSHVTLAISFQKQN